MVQWKKYALILAIATGFIIGVAVGFGFGKSAGVLKPLGDFFIRLMRMIVTPLVIITISAAVAQIADLRKLGKLVIGTFVIFISLSIIAAAWMLGPALYFKPGAGVGLTPPPGYKPPTPPTVADILLNLVPTDFGNILNVSGLLQAIVFSILFGLAVSLLGDKGRPISEALLRLSDVMIKLTTIIMWYAPIGVFGYAAWVIGTYGVGILVAYGRLLAVDYAFSLIFFFVAYTIVVWLSGLNPLKYWYAIIEPAIIAFSTRSSAVALPVNLKIAKEKLNVPDYVAQLVLPTGATCHMDGTAMYQVLSTVFIAQVFGLPISPALYGTIIVVAALAAVATAAVPSGGLLMLAMTVGAAGMPLEGIALITPIDPLLDMLRTMINAEGDVAVSTLMARILEGPKWWEKGKQSA
ncbi:MAG: dicarboxylate/amino acid:cation symporter [Thermoprotei archaeon]|nr:dicarboxylate/amino acid:cation symporter [Thermoprotei archaeon]